MTSFVTRDIRDAVRYLRRNALPVDSLLGFGFAHNLHVGDWVRSNGVIYYVLKVQSATAVWVGRPPWAWYVGRALRIALPAFALMAAVVWLTSCGGGQAVKTVNVERTTTNTVGIAKATLCPKPEEWPALPPLTAVPDNSSTDQLAAAAAADRESLARYSRAVDAMFKRCAETVK